MIRYFGQIGKKDRFQGIMKRRKIGVLALSACLLLSSCSLNEADISKDTLCIGKDGKVTEILVDIFDREYYSLEELEAMAKTEIAEYNAKAGADKVTYLSGVEDEDRKVEMKMEYADADSFADYHNTLFFYGTVSDAHRAGMDLDYTLYGTGSKATTIGKKDILEMGDAHILIMDQDTNVKMPSEITYVSSNVKSVSKKNAEVDYEGNPVVIICK